jgi:hypothetical protein
MSLRLEGIHGSRKGESHSKQRFKVHLNMRSTILGISFCHLCSFSSSLALDVNMADPLPH